MRGIGHFLYDSMRLNERSSLHGELAASAYTIALNLSFEQEAFLNAAMQLIGLEQGVATPASLVTGSTKKANTGDTPLTSSKGSSELSGLSTLVGETDTVKEMMGTSSVASFSDAESRQAAEVALMIFIAKVLALDAAGETPDVMILNGANRVFSNLPLARHGNRLLTALLASATIRVFVSEHTYGLDHHFIDTAPLRILSSNLWNEVTRVGSRRVGCTPPAIWPAGKGSARLSQAMILTPNMFVLQDSARGYEEVFVPRRFPAYPIDQRRHR